MLPVHTSQMLLPSCCYPFLWTLKFIGRLHWGFPASFPALFKKSEKRARYLLFAHALNFLGHSGYSNSTVLPPCVVTSGRYIAVCLIIHCWQRLFVCNTWRWGKTTALKLEKKASMKHVSWLLISFGSYKSYYEVIAYIVVCILYSVYSAVQAISVGVRRPWQRTRRAALTSSAIWYKSRYNTSQFITTYQLTHLG